MGNARATAVRRWLLLLAVLGWLWSVSVFSPWAESAAARIWLYDIFYYARFVLGFWAAFEIGLLLLRRSAGARRGWPALLLAALALAAAGVYAFTGAGQRLKVAASAQALAAQRTSTDSQARVRVGHFIVDTRRHPCGDTWLWLGRPFGAGSGINLALADAGDQPPQAPHADAFRTWPAGDGWWLVYQHGRRYHQDADGPASACGPVRRVDSHLDGMRFVAEGRLAP